uniref:Glycosyl transferase n=1 Tax=uncultured marine thaumarchaeote KM3_82_A11 TaxID=1456301 RepID=A0A075HQM7_9ARCH|nr:glycosyl transferase [uncultured marine thaumarchaeote KM3_82_A11]
MKLLITGDKTRFYHLEGFMNALQKNGIKCKLIYDIEYSNKFFDINIKNRLGKQKKLKKLLDEFGPDVVLLDRLSGIATEITKAGIPFFILLRGNIWEELKWAKETIYTSPQKRLSFLKKQRFIKTCFNNASVILPISKYLENVVRKNIPEKNIELFSADGRDPSEWNQVSGMNLKHPCVGLLQGMNIWGKTRELLILTKVMKELPGVTFYFAGDGFYKDKIIPKLKNFKNFVWLGNLEYPIEVKKFLSEIDVYLLLSGMEGLGQTIIEAFLMEKPVIATNIGGIPELIEDGKTGFLIEAGNHDDLIKKINQVFDQPVVASNMGSKGKETMQENFNWDSIAKKLVLILNRNVQ